MSDSNSGHVKCSECSEKKAMNKTTSSQKTYPACSLQTRKDSNVAGVVWDCKESRESLSVGTEGHDHKELC